MAPAKRLAQLVTEGLPQTLREAIPTETGQLSFEFQHEPNLKLKPSGSF